MTDEANAPEAARYSQSAARLIGVDFNPSKIPEVDRIKSLAAELVTAIEPFKQTKSGEINRLASLAMTHVETAAMFAVKAATRLKS